MMKIGAFFRNLFTRNGDDSRRALTSDEGSRLNSGRRLFDESAYVGTNGPRRGAVDVPTRTLSSCGGGCGGGC